VLHQLIALFTGKSVRITTYTREGKKPVEGVCETVCATPGDAEHFDIILKGGGRFGFVPEKITDTLAEGALEAGTVGRRVIQLI